VSVIETLAGTTGPLWLSDVVRVLDALGVGGPVRAAGLVADLWPDYAHRNGGNALRGAGFRLGPTGHAYFLRGGAMFDPLTGRWTRLTATSIRTALHWIWTVPDPEWTTRHVRRRIAQPSERDHGRWRRELAAGRGRPGEA
jgi:hypothetical protein